MAVFAAALAAANTAMNGTVIYAYYQTGGDHYVFADTNGDGTADQAVILVGGGTVTSASFL
jgi:hypothetical protein